MSTGPQSPDSAQQPTVFDDKADAGARNYAEALLKVAEAEGQVDPVLDEMREILRDVFGAHPQFARVLHGAMGQEDRDRLLVRLFEGRAMPVVLKFLRVLNRHGRLELLGSIVRQAQASWDRKQNRKPVTIRSAAPLDEGQLASLRARLISLTGGEPVVSVEVDPDLIGGLVVQIGDEVYDASIRSRLERMRRQVVHEKVHEFRRRFAETTTA